MLTNKILTRQYKLPLLICLILVSLRFCTKYSTKPLQINSESTQTLVGREMKFFSVELGSHSGNEDLLIETQLTQYSKLANNILSPILLVSLKPMPNVEKTSIFMCGELGHETCFVPAKYLSSLKAVYLGISCADCELNIKTSFATEENLVPGESKLLHLKKRDSKIFTVNSVDANAKWLQISAFNLKMTDFEMQVEKVGANQQENQLVNVARDWLGGKSATVQNLKQSVKYRIILTSTKSDAVFNIEARTDSSINKIDDRSLKFEGLKQNSKVCYLYNVKNEQSDISIETRSIKGLVEFSIFPFGDSKQRITFNNEKELTFNLTAEERKLKAASKGDWTICAQAKSESSFFTVSIYDAQNGGLVKEHKKLLYKLLKSESMYDLEHLESLLPKSKEETFRILLQNEVNADSNSNTVQPAYGNSTGEININGSGVAGLGVVVLFLIPVIIGSFALMSIFVNTKFLDQPIRIKIMD